ncbi:MAG TPA: spondin domain-containing protein [Polyangiaceae bacterium]|nr:spondin domain-containing protein [Polyangiaceae bacterium]
MKLRNLAVVFCAASALLVACGSDDDSGSNGGAGAGAGGKNTAGTSGKAGSAGTSGKGGGAGTTSGTGGNAGADTAGAAGEGGNPEAAGSGGEGGATNVETFTVTLENVAESKANTSSGGFDTPEGDTVAGPATPGKSYKFTVDAGRKQKLFFATMLAATNDLFFAPNGDGIPLYLDNGSPISADVTAQVYLWDAGTELNEEPFVGANTVTNQGTVNTGAVDTNTKVRKIGSVTEGFVFSYPAVSSLIKVTVMHTTGTLFEVTIADLSTAALTTGDLVSHPAPISPGVWAVSSSANALFTEQLPVPAHGLEALAEDGKPATLATYLAANTGITFPASPGVWLLHKAGTKPLFTAGAADLGKGLEAIAEDGNPAPLDTNRATLDGYLAGGIFNVPVGATSPGPIVPGSKYQFTFDASPGDSLSFASMLAATNDVFIAPKETGIPLFDDEGAALTGNVSDQLFLWDAGTEGNEEPAIGLNTVTNQLTANTGAVGEGKVQLLSAVTTDTYVYPTVQSILKVTIAKK